MRLKSSIFFKLFGLMVFGFLLVFLIQFVTRTLFFDQMYISNIHNKNIADINQTADLLDQGYDLYFIIGEQELTDISAYVVDDLDFFEDFLDHGDDEFNDYETEFVEQDGVFYQVFDDPEVDAVLTFYYKELDEETYLVFEHYLYGLTIANQALYMIDLYVIIGLAVFLVPYTYWYSRRFSKPLQAMNKQVSALSQLEFLEPLEVTSSDEIGELTKSINSVSVSLEEAIGKLKDDIEFEQYKDKKRRELIASLSHELKTPITTLRAVIEGMSDNIGKYANRDVYLKESLDYLHYMETLSKDLIDAINIESKTIKEDSYSLLEIFQQSKKFAIEQITKKNQVLENDLEDCMVLVNKEMIMRVFINVLTNASKYSGQNETIKVTSKIQDDFVTIEILNTGAYIKPGDLTHLFEPFYRVEKSRSKDTGGSGLGLFIIRSILEGHQSEYSIRNEVNGVVFSFTLKTDTLVTK